MGEDLAAVRKVNVLKEAADVRGIILCVILKRLVQGSCACLRGGVVLHAGKEQRQRGIQYAGDLA